MDKPEDYKNYYSGIINTLFKLRERQYTDIAHLETLLRKQKISGSLDMELKRKIDSIYEGVVAINISLDLLNSEIKRLGFYQ